MRIRSRTSLGSDVNFGDEVAQEGKKLQFSAPGEVSEDRLIKKKRCSGA